VGTQDGSFAISNVAVTAGANLLTVTVEDVTGNIGTQVVNFTVQTVTNGSQFAYDGNGNLSSVTGSSSGNWSYQYDAENRLVNVTSNGVTVLQCWYDGAGHRVAKQEIAGTQTNAVQYIWDGWTLVAVLDGNGQLQEFYTRGVGIAGDVGSLVAVTLYSGGNPFGTYYLHNNHRGDMILVRNGTITVATLDYTPYGELRSQSGRYQPRFRFSSKEYDVSTGFYHFPYRYYAPQWARWPSRDSIGEEGGENLYSFAGNDPVTRMDELGLAFYAVDGTLTDASHHANPWQLSHETKESPSRYFPGPRSGATGADAWAIALAVYDYVGDDFCAARKEGHDLKINLTGWSRGAMIAATVAKLLNNNGCWCIECGSFKHYQPVAVNWVGLFDAVSMMDNVGLPTEVPSNVAHFDHAIKTMDQALFPTWHFDGGNERAFYRYDGTQTSHRDIGESKILGNNDSYNWIRQQAIAAGVAF